MTDIPVAQPTAAAPFSTGGIPNAAPWIATWSSPPQTGNITESYTDVVEAEYAQLKQLLAEFGLSEIYDQVAQFITADSTAPEIALAMREIPEYRQRFRVIFEREEAGLPPMSPAEVVEYEKQYAQLLSFYGVPIAPGENLQEMAAEQMIGDKSLPEVQARLTAMAAFGRAVLDDPNQDQEIVQQILGNGGTLFDVANFALDPEKTLDQIERRLAAAEIANVGSGAGYRVNADEALELARRGVDGQQAQQGFGVLRQQSQVVDRLIGDTDDPVSRQQELAALSGDVEAQAAIERSGQRRVAALSAGGGFATDEEGFAGLR